MPDYLRLSQLHTLYSSSHLGVDTAGRWPLCGRSWLADTTRSRRRRWTTPGILIWSQLLFFIVQVTIGKTDCTMAPAFCTAEGVTGFPTLKFYKNGFEREEGVKYKGNRETANLEKFIHEQLGLETSAGQHANNDLENAVAEDGLYSLSSSSFDKVVGSGDTFVEFYAPWNAQSQRLARIWDDLAKSFEKDEEVKIGEIDCVQYSDVCKKQEVKGYPSLIYFRSVAP